MGSQMLTVAFALLCLPSMVFSMLVTNKHIQKNYLGFGATTGHVVDPSRCGKYKPEDLDKPVSQVIRENPGVHMYCYFDGVTKNEGEWIRAEIHNGPTFELMGYYDRPECMAAPGKGKFGSILYLGDNVTDHFDCGDYEMDDIYFYSLGWLKDQRLDGSPLKQHNWTAWLEQGKKECDSFMDAYNFTDEEVTVGHLVRDNTDLVQRSRASWRGGPPVPRREYALHIYIKCAMDHGPWEMAYAYNRACLLPGNLIGHSTQCL